MVSDRFVVPFILTAVYFLAGCTGEDGNANSAVSRSMVTNPSPTSTNQGNSNDSNLEPDVILTEELRLGKETQFQLTFPGGYSCTDGVNQVTWRLIGGAERISIQNTDRCQPVISTTSLFEGGDASLEADLVATDGRKIRWTTSIGFQEAPEIIFADSDFVQTESEWLTASGDTLGTSAMDCLPSASNCQTGRLYLGTWGG